MATDIRENPAMTLDLEIILEHIRENIKTIRLKAAILERKIIKDDVIQKVA